MNYVIVFAGAGIGGMARHGVNVLAWRLFGPGFPVGTLAVNVLGSFVLGLLTGWFAHKADPGSSWHLFLMTGFLGGFTTFSTFSLDAALLIERGQVGLAGIYILASVGVGIAGLFAGLFLIRLLF